jgi:flagellar basal-body rod protein FlgF
MDRLLYLASTGARQLLQAQGVNSHNLANATTTGFRADLLTSKSVPVQGPGFGSRTYASIDQMVVSYAEGTVYTTGRDLDVAINGKGWMAIQGPDGTEVYTRAGNLHQGTGGVLLTAAGDPVIGNAGPIAIPPAESITIGSDGTISIRPVGEAATNVIEIDRIKLVDIPVANLAKGTDGRIRVRDGQAPPPDANIRVAPGSLESSNVNAVESLVTMIQLARAYETQIKLMREAEQMDEADTRLLSLGGG